MRDSVRRSMSTEVEIEREIGEQERVRRGGLPWSEQTRRRGKNTKINLSKMTNYFKRNLQK